MGSNARPAFNTAIGAQVRQLRELAGLTQDALVRKVRSWGLGWTRSTLAKIELGQRSVGFDEAPLLAGALEVRLRDLVPPGWLSSSPGAAIRGEAFQELLAGAHPNDLPPRVFDVEWSRRSRGVLQSTLIGWSETIARCEPIWPKASAKTMLLARQAAGGEPERRLASQLNLHPEQLAMLAYRRWGMSLTEKREQRLRDKGQTKEDTAALRGHVTRALRDELVAAREKFAKQDREARPTPRKGRIPGANLREYILSASDAEPLPKEADS